MYHRSLGKFLRAVEKSLLVTTPWEPPSYTYVPLATQGAARTFYGADADSDAGTSDSEDSTMPRAATTPMFSPIPFLVRDHMDDIEAHHPNGLNGLSVKSEGLMSPLMLGNSSDDGRFGSDAAFDPRSPTPEPEDSKIESHDETTSAESEDIRPETDTLRANLSNNAPASTNLPAAHLTGSESQDPGHQPYLGRVDELDTGPLSDSASANGGHIDDDGTGEGGNMTPHGMSDKPVPISSTTTVPSGENRDVAPLPRSRSESHRQT